ncbi:PIH1 family [Lipomyces kononenkoae]
MLGEDEHSLVPSPGFVVKTSLEAPTTDPQVAAGTKVFLNICSNKRVPEAPGGLDKIEEAILRDDWAIPVIVSSARDDIDKAGSKCLVYDCCVNTKILQRALRDANVRIILIESCLEVAEGHAGTTFSREYKLPKLRWKGPVGVPIVYRNGAAPSKSPNGTAAASEHTITSTLDDLAMKIANDEKNMQKANGDRSSPTKRVSNNSLLFVEQEGDQDIEGVSLLPNSVDKSSKKSLIQEIGTGEPTDADLPEYNKADFANVDIRDLKRTVFPLYQVSVTSEDTKALSSATLEIDESSRLLVVKLQGSTAKDVAVKVPSNASLETMQAFFATDTDTLSIFL